MKIPDGVTIPCIVDHSEIEPGWNRVTDLDAKYIRAIPNSSTDPGDTGGAVSHSHSTPGHTHSLTHSHSSATSGSAAATTSTNVGGDEPPVSVVHDSPHTHSFTLSNQTLTSGSASPGTNSVANDPANLEVIWLESDGTPSNLPAGALGFFAGAVLPVEATLYEDAKNRFLKGAPTEGDAGDVGAGTLASHTHNIDDHTHTGQSHNHPSTTSGGSSSRTEGGDANTRPRGGHTHPVTSNSVATGSTGNPTATPVSGAQSVEPPFKKLAIVSASELFEGYIAIWRRALSLIPEDWVLCNGENDTIDMCDGSFVKGADALGEVGDTGGTSTHTHTGATHTHTIGSHSHSATFGTISDSSDVGTTTPNRSFALTNHQSSHNTTSAAASNFVGSETTGNLSSESHIPAYETVAFIMCTKVVTGGEGFFNFF